MVLAYMIDWFHFTGCYVVHEKTESSHSGEKSLRSQTKDADKSGNTSEIKSSKRVPSDETSRSPTKKANKDPSNPNTEKGLQEKIKNLRESGTLTALDGSINSRQYKANDFRRELLKKQLAELRKLSRLSKLSVSIQPAPVPDDVNAISVDTSRSGSNIDVLRLCLKSLKWREYPTGKKGGQEACDVTWLSVSCFDNCVLSGGFINKYPNVGAMLHKISLFRCLDSMRSLFPQEYTFYPMTWYLPHQLQDLTTYIKQATGAPQSNNRSTANTPATGIRPVLSEQNKETTTASSGPTFIVKPDDGTQGEGIYLLRTAEDYKPNAKRNHVVQEYLDNPLLLDGYKFDLRVYVVLWSISPLKIYICREGLARFCTQAYERPTMRNLASNFMHLTNYSLNKHSVNYVHSQQVDEGSKRALSRVFLQLEERGYNVHSIWRNIETIVCRTLLALLPEFKVAYASEITAKCPSPQERPSCFQILGFDVLLLENGKAMLLEVNSNPSLRIDGEKELAQGICEYYLSRVDVQVKRPLVLDTLRLVADAMKARRPSTSSGAKSEDALTSPTGDEVSSSHDETGSESTKTQAGLSDTIPLSTIEEGAFIQHVYPGDETCMITISGSCPKSRRQEQHRKEQMRRQRELSWIRLEESRSVHARREQDPDEGDELQSRETSSVEEARKASARSSSGSASGVEGPPLVASAAELLSSDDARQCSQHHIHDLKDDMGLQESCLSEIYPGPDHINLRRNQPLNILEKVSHIFHEAVGQMKSNARMSSNGFRIFARKCNMSSLGFSNATIDLTFIDVQRRWEYLHSEKQILQPGLCYQAFLEAFFRLSFQRYPHNSKPHAVSKLAQHCCEQMRLVNWLDRPQAYDEENYHTSDSQQYNAYQSYLADHLGHRKKSAPHATATKSSPFLLPAPTGALVPTQMSRGSPLYSMSTSSFGSSSHDSATGQTPLPAMHKSSHFVTSNGGRMQPSTPANGDPAEKPSTRDFGFGENSTDKTRRKGHGAHFSLEPPHLRHLDMGHNRHRAGIRKHGHYPEHLPVKQQLRQSAVAELQKYLDDVQGKQRHSRWHINSTEATCVLPAISLDKP